MNAFSGIPESAFFCAVIRDVIVMDLNVSTKNGKLVLFLYSVLAGENSRVFRNSSFLSKNLTKINCFVVSKVCVVNTFYL